MKTLPLFALAIVLLSLGCRGPDGAAPIGEVPASAVRSQALNGSVAGIPLRYLTINVGNASPQYGCWEYKLCRPTDVANLRTYIATWQPDIIMLSEVYRATQLTGTDVGGPILPAGYTGVCGASVDRYTGATAAYDASNASHEHECVAWKTGRLSLVPGSTRSAYGRNDSWGQSNCKYDFTGFRAQLVLDGQLTVTAVALHPDSGNSTCRTEEIGRYWSQLAQGSNVIIGGDWNTESATELQRPASYATAYSGGTHWMLATHDEYTAFYVLGIAYRYDHAFTNFGAACTSCGGSYGSPDLTYGSACGGYDGMPRADNGEGMDHRQLLMDLVAAGSSSGCAHPTSATGAALADGCDACTASVCASDGYCCTTSWDSLCVSEASQRCTSCSHATSITGSPLYNGCNACVSRVCGVDPRCCNNTWDATCVGEAATLCP